MKPRKTSNVLGWIALAAVALITIGIYSPVTADIGPGEESSSRQAAWQHMTEMRDIMHLARVVAQPLENGVQVSVTSEEAALAETIVREFVGERHELAPPAPGVTVEAKSAENGVVIVYTATEPETVRWLQSAGEQLVYNELRNNMHNLMTGQGGFGNRGFGHMGGWMHGPGAGWMHGPGPRGQSGYGPGGHGPGMGWGMGPGGYR